MTDRFEHLTARALLDTLPQPPQHISGDGRALEDTVLALCCDSRTACEGTLFVCIRGAASDGHRYAHAAYEGGCRLFLVEAPIDEPLPADATLLLSDDTHRDLALLAAAFYGHPAKELRVIGITGTKGKTTVALMCYHILKKCGQAVGYIGTSGVLYGEVHRTTRNTTPGALELQKHLHDMYSAGITTVLLEVSSQALWQRRVDGIPFAICALTNLYPDHIGAPEHPTFEHYAACKQRLLTDFGAPLIIGNADAQQTHALLKNVSGELIWCGLDRTAERLPDLHAQDISAERRGARPITHFVCHSSDGACAAIDLPLPGEHNVYNALFALAIVRALGIPLADAACALEDISIPGRFELIEVRGALVVIDYAHNGAALRAALTSLRPLCAERLLCLVGSVGGRTQCRRAELGTAADELADYTYLTADDPDGESVEDICRDMAAAFKTHFLPNYTVIPDREKAIRTALDELRTGDVLLIAGKGDDRTMRIGGKDVPHRDRDVVERYIEESALPV